MVWRYHATVFSKPGSKGMMGCVVEDVAGPGEVGEGVFDVAGAFGVVEGREVWAVEDLGL